MSKPITPEMLEALIKLKKSTSFPKSMFYGGFTAHPSVKAALIRRELIEPMQGREYSWQLTAAGWKVLKEHGKDGPEELAW